jgi:cytochrome b pre-mRNA-processing protein 3
MATPTHPTARRRSREIGAALAIVGAVLAALLLWRSNQVEERQAIEQLAERDRRALYERTLRTLSSPSCDPEKQPAGLEPFCREQAEFIVQFPECDEACRTLARPHRSKPTK